MVHLRARRRLLAALAACISGIGMGGPAQAKPIGPALDRPAVISPVASRSMLLGAVQAGSRLVAVGERGIVIVSDDGGLRWRQVPTPVSVTLTTVRFADARHGYAVGHGGTVLATDDGGETWTRILDGRQAARIALAAAQAGGSSAALRDAERLMADGPDKPFLDLLVLDARRVIAVGAYGLAFATEDAGRTWTSWMDRMQNPGSLHLYAIRRRGERIVVCGEQGLVRLSLDAGRSFSVLQAQYEGSYFTAELPTADEIVIAGLRGNAWRSWDAGATWTRIAAPDAASITASALRPDGSPVFVNQAGMILDGRDAALVPVNRSPLPSLTSIAIKRDGTLLLTSTQGLVSAPDGDPK